MATRPLTEADMTLLHRACPELRDSGSHAGLHYAVVRYAAFEEPMVEAWGYEPYYHVSVWMPGATRERVRLWIEGLARPVKKVAA